MILWWGRGSACGWVATAIRITVVDVCNCHNEYYYFIGRRLNFSFFTATQSVMITFHLRVDNGFCRTGAAVVETIYRLYRDISPSMVGRLGDSDWYIINHGHSRSFRRISRFSRRLKIDRDLFRASDFPRSIRKRDRRRWQQWVRNLNFQAVKSQTLWSGCPVGKRSTSKSNLNLKSI